MKDPSNLIKFFGGKLWLYKFLCVLFGRYSIFVSGFSVSYLSIDLGNSFENGISTENGYLQISSGSLCCFL